MLKEDIFYNVTTAVTTTTTMLKWTVVTKPETFRKRIVVSSHFYLLMLNTIRIDDHILWFIVATINKFLCLPVQIGDYT